MRVSFFLLFYPLCFLACPPSPSLYSKVLPRRSECTPSLLFPSMVQWVRVMRVGGGGTQGTVAKGDLGWPLHTLSYLPYLPHRIPHCIPPTLRERSLALALTHLGSPCGLQVNWLPHWQWATLLFHIETMSSEDNPASGPLHMLFSVIWNAFLPDSCTLGPSLPSYLCFSAIISF